MSARLLIAAAWPKPIPPGTGAEDARAGRAGGLDLAPTRSGFRQIRDRAGAMGPPAVSPAGRALLLALAAVTAGLACVPGASAQTQTSTTPAAAAVEPLESRSVESREPPSRIGGVSPDLCVQVDIAGDRAGHLDCAVQALQQAGRLAQSQARSAIDTPVLEAGSPDVSVGVSSLSGSRLRMGNALGVSVHPQRPTPSFSAPRPGAPAPPVAVTPPGGHP